MPKSKIKRNDVQKNTSTSKRNAGIIHYLVLDISPVCLTGEIPYKSRAAVCVIYGVYLPHCNSSYNC